MTRDRTDFEQFVTEHGAALLRFSRHLTRDPYRAEDLLQKALTDTYARWSRVRRQDAVRYVRKAVVNAYIGSWRRRWSAEVAMDVPDRGDRRQHDEDTVTRLTLESALGRLPPRQRTVLVLRYLLDLPDREIAEMLGIDAGTVRSQAHRALASLRRDFAGDGGAAPEPALRQSALNQTALNQPALNQTALTTLENGVSPWR
jgi:RNA polymerase sigma-70 factor (sigma-E family)